MMPFPNHCHVRVRPYIHKLLKILAAHTGRPVNRMLDDILTEILEQRFLADNELKIFMKK